MKLIVEDYKGRVSFEMKRSEELQQLSEMSRYVEMDFEMEMHQEEQLPALAIFKEQSMLFATIGVKQSNERVDAFYDIESDTLITKNKERNLQETYWVSCYTKHNTLTAIGYIQCITRLINWAKVCKKPLVIYSQVIPKEKFYRYRSLTGKIINKLLETVNGVIVMQREKAEIAAYYIPSHKGFEFYIDKGIYLTCDYEEMINRVVSCLKYDRNCDFREVYRRKWRSESLYDDLFYEMIPDEEKIYVAVSEAGEGVCSYLEEIGLQVISGTNTYSLIYDVKSKINAKANQLRPYIVPRYDCPILERGAFKSSISQGKNMSYPLVAGDLAYKGKGVYIAIVSERGVDYRLSSLRNADGTTRIAGIWYQIDGGKGTFYTQAQINEALQSDVPESIVPINEVSDENTFLLNIAGGKGENYQGIATEAEFLIAKVNGAPENVQMIYGGMPNKENILMADAIVGVWMLQDFARKKQKPAIFYMPYYTNIDGHDGLTFYNVLMSFVAATGGNAVITPTGEEGDKQHHQTLYDGTISEPIVNLKCEQDGQNVIGLITQRYLSSWQIEVTAPSGKKVSITRAGKYTLEQATIYSQGEQANYYSGTKEIMFRISNMYQGTWLMEVKIQNNGHNRVDLWISGEASNPYVTLFPQNPYVTIGSIGNSGPVTCVGGYNLEEMTTLRASGRGYTMDDRVKPTLSANGILEIVNAKGENMRLEGTEVSASIIVGAAATIFEKWEKEKGKPLLNGTLLNSILLEYITQFTNIPFPNPNQGYGVFEQDTLNKILLTPFNG